MAQLQPPRGTHDLFGPEGARHQHCVDVFRRVSELYGFRLMQTPIFEHLQVFDRTLGEDSDIVSKEMYVFEDRGGDRLCLRPEGTAGVVRAFLSNSLQRDLPLKFSYAGPMFRYERPQKGRTRQFHQVGVEALGIENPLIDAEVLALGFQIFKELGLNKKIRLELNSLGSTDDRAKYRNALVEYFSRHEGSLSEDSKRRLQKNPLRILDSKASQDRAIVEGAPQLGDFLSSAAKEQFSKVQDFLRDLGLPYILNPRLVRGLDYYNDLVFEFKTDSLGAQDTVLSGGRYDGLVQTMGGPATAGVGFAAGVERLSLMLDRDIPTSPPIVFVAPSEASEARALEIGQLFREKGLSVEQTYSGNFSKRMKRADRFSARWAVIIGDTELTSGQLTLKDLSSGEQETLTVEEVLRKLSG
jgi:histidyl-tRNA synthetase